MRNILIKTISSIILVFLFTIVSIAQREVVFVHGFNSEGGTWTKYRNWLLTTAGSTVSSDIPKDYIWYNGIQNFANDVSRYCLNFQIKKIKKNKKSSNFANK